MCWLVSLSFINGERARRYADELCDDLFTFRTELKKTAISITKQSYDIFPKGAAMRSEEIKKRVVATASRLIKTGDYLRIPDSSNVGDDSCH